MNMEQRSASVMEKNPQKEKLVNAELQMPERYRDLLLSLTESAEIAAEQK